MITAENIQLSSHGHDLDMSEDCLGQFVDGTHLLEDFDSLRQHMTEHGYIYLPGYLDRQQVLETRGAITAKLAQTGLLDPAYPAMDAMPNPAYDDSQRHPLAQHDPALEELLYAGKTMQFFERYFGKQVRHFDYTWLRAVPPGPGTPTHCDIVYMGRGSHNLHTAWTPLGDIDLVMGGLIILDKSHHHQRMRETYCQKDVDTYCTNRPDGEKVKSLFGENGMLAPNPRKIRHSLGGRWLVGEFKAGDLVVFNMFMVHGSLDNHSSQIRLSSDSRYQPADEPVDERWNGPNPPTHGPNAKRGIIC